jgi:2-phosphoxylose phosphatase
MWNWYTSHYLHSCCYGLTGEQIHRHHKRTPYASNTFPHEGYAWDCNDQGLFYYGEPLNPTDHAAASTYWNVSLSPVNPFAPTGFNGSCQFPQISRGGLDDSYQHGEDLYEVYHDMLHFLPDRADQSVVYRVTNNVITSQVTGMLIKAMYPDINGPYPLQIQPDSIDSLEPTYTCPSASLLYSSYGVGSTNSNWTSHLTAARPIFAALDAISGVSSTDIGFHQSFDHYFDNLSARQCHDKPLPCNITNPSLCVNRTLTDAVYRFGEYEYSYVYRNAGPQALQASTASYGVWVAELAQNIRDSVSGASKVKYRHNVAHDGSVSRLLSILQIDVMVWPGMVKSTQSVPIA